MLPESVKNFLGSSFYLGLIPVAPGSFAALLGVACHGIAAYLLQPDLRQGFLFFAFLGACLVHYVFYDWAQAFWNDPDPGHFTMDEVAGYLIVPLFFPYGTPWKVMLLGFLMFRVIDIIKIPPAREVDRDMHNVWGVILDDWIAGAYTVVLLYLLLGIGGLVGLGWLLV